jgi:hypothetical protein
MKYLYKLSMSLDNCGKYHPAYKIPKHKSYIMKDYLGYIKRIPAYIAGKIHCWLGHILIYITDI